MGCDFSSDSTLAFQYGLSLAQEFESELHLVHVIEPPIYQHLLSANGRSNGGVRNGIAPRLRQRLSEMIPAEACHWCLPETVLLEGKPDEELCRYAKVNNMDLVVLGVRGQGLMESLFIGSTTERVARQAPCPVLSARPVG